MKAGTMTTDAELAEAVRRFVDPSLPVPELKPGYHVYKGKRRYRLDSALATLAKVIERAKAINADRSLPFLVNEILLFGSVLRGQAMVGDLDLYCTVRLRDSFSFESAQKWLWRRGEGGPPIVGFRSIELAALRRLRARSPTVSFCHNDPRKLGWPCSVVFNRRPPRR
jgi:hypothetical protein